MSHPLTVKVCGLTSVDDALAACALGADLVGFIFVPGTSRCIAPEAARAIISLLPPRVAAVGVFAGEKPERMHEVAALCGLSYVQLHGDGDAGKAALPGLPSIRVARVGGADDIAAAERLPPGLLLLDTRVKGALGGTGRAFDWALARGLCACRPVIVAGGLTPGNVGEAVRTLHPWGVDVCSGVERSPGVKDHDKVAKFIRAARAAAGKEAGTCPD
jgi:phosphoribosylanthranilate isomerase